MVDCAHVHCEAPADVLLTFHHTGERQVFCRSHFEALDDFMFDGPDSIQEI
jgi:hypothetical protein